MAWWSDRRNLKWEKFKDCLSTTILVITIVVAGLSLLSTLKFFFSLERPGPRRGLVWVDGNPYIITQTSTYGGYAYPAGKYNEEPLDKVRLKK